MRTNVTFSFSAAVFVEVLRSEAIPHRQTRWRKAGPDNIAPRPARREAVGRPHPRRTFVPRPPDRSVSPGRLADGHRAGGKAIRSSRRDRAELVSRRARPGPWSEPWRRGD